MEEPLFDSGKSYLITTEKEVMLQDAPWPSLLKRSTYAIRTLTSVPEEHAQWWVPTDQPHIVVNKNKGTKYLLCTLAKDAGVRGTSEFVDMSTGTVYAKREVVKWLPKQEFNSDHICIGINSISRSTCLEKTTIILEPKPEPALYKSLDRLSIELIEDGATAQDREKILMELTGCDILDAVDLVKRKFPILDPDLPF